MKPPRIFTPHNALKDRLHDNRGLDALVATKAADVAVRTYKPEGMAEIQRALELLWNELQDSKASGALNAFNLTRIYASADLIVGLAAFFGRPQLGEAASSLCKMVTDQNGRRPDAVVVHIEAILLIAKNDSLGSCMLPSLLNLHEIFQIDRGPSAALVTGPALSNGSRHSSI